MKNVGQVRRFHRAAQPAYSTQIGRTASAGGLGRISHAGRSAGVEGRRRFSCGVPTLVIVAAIAAGALFMSPGMSAQDASGGEGVDFLEVDNAADELLAEIDFAIEDDRYTRAISLIEEGKSAFPVDYRFSLRAGWLYQDKGLYRLAKAEFLAALEFFPESFEILHELARTYGYLGDNTASVGVLEELLVLLREAGESSEQGSEFDRVIEDLSWMYFKTYRLEDGVALLEKALEERFDREWAHTLGTLYSGLYDIEQSRYWYERSIEDALENGDDYFASVARYNLSLLETSFYLYNEAREQAEESLALMERSGGHLILGELSMLAWDLNEALAAYRRAESLDDTPLSKLDIAVLYQRIGAPDEALRFIREIRSSGDESWMYSYGLDSVRFGMDISEILSDLWRGKAEIDLLTPRAGILNRVGSFGKRLLWRARALYEDRRYRALALRYQEELRARGNLLDASWNAFLASRGYRRTALAHLGIAEKIETGLTERAEVWYQLEEGREEKNSELLAGTLARFLPEEAGGVEESLRTLAELALRRGAGRKVRRDRNLEAVLADLYTLNPGGLRQYGLSLPVTLRVGGSVEGTRSRAIVERRIRGLLRRSGYTVRSRKGGDDVGPTETVLTMSLSGDDEFKWYWADPDGRTRVSGTYQGDFSRRRLAGLLAGALEVLYRTDLEDASR